MTRSTTYLKKTLIYSVLLLTLPSVVVSTSYFLAGMGSGNSERCAELGGTVLNAAECEEAFGDLTQELWHQLHSSSTWKGTHQGDTRPAYCYYRQGFNLDDVGEVWFNTNFNEPDSVAADEGVICKRPSTTTVAAPSALGSSNPAVKCLQPFAEYDVSVYSDGGNKYAIGESSRPSDRVYGLTQGVYYFKIPDSHPMGIHSNGPVDSNQLAYGASDGHAATTSSGYVSGHSIDFVAGVMKVEVKDDFGNLSVHCNLHGAMGGADLLKFDTTCTPHAWALQDHQIQMNQIEVTPLST